MQILEPDCMIFAPTASTCLMLQYLDPLDPSFCNSRGILPFFSLLSYPLVLVVHLET